MPKEISKRAIIIIAATSNINLDLLNEGLVTLSKTATGRAMDGKIDAPNSIGRVDTPGWSCDCG